MHRARRRYIALHIGLPLLVAAIGILCTHIFFEIVAKKKSPQATHAAP